MSKLKAIKNFLYVFIFSRLKIKNGEVKDFTLGKLKKPDHNPLIEPEEENDWEKWQTFNPAAILIDDEIHLVYRALGPDGASRFGYARTTDGLIVEERLSYAIYAHKSVGTCLNIEALASGGGFQGCEDPRMMRVEGEDRIYMTYTACDGGLRIGLTSIKVEDFVNKNWKWETPKLISPPGEIHKNWVIFPEKIKGKYAIIHSISPEISIDYRDNLKFNGEERHIESTFTNGGPVEDGWEEYIRGVGAPPIKTKYGWLILYHAMDKNDPGKYKVGAMLLDLEDPQKVLHRSKDPILEPDCWHDNNGFKPGVVYVTGAVAKDGKLYIYYGGADSYVNVAYADFEQFLQNLIQQ